MGEVITAPVLESMVNLVGLLFRPKERQREKNHLRQRWAWKLYEHIEIF